MSNAPTRRTLESHNRKHFPALASVKWRAKRIIRNRTEEQIQTASEVIEEWITEIKEQRLRDATEAFLRDHTERLYENGGWELAYLPDSADDPDGRPYFPSMAEIRDLLENWPPYADDRPSFPTDDLEDFDALGEVLNDGFPYDAIESFDGATAAELYAVLALSKAQYAEWLLRVEERRNEHGALIWPGEFPWDISRAIEAGALLVEAMEIVCYAERNLSDAQFHKMREEMHAKTEAQIRQETKSQIGKAGAAAKLAKDPKQLEKAAVRECWDAWQIELSRYKGVAAFARDMLQKFESLESQQVIERWCRTWAKDTQQPE